jgi:hypothetical protein
VHWQCLASSGYDEGLGEAAGVDVDALRMFDRWGCGGDSIDGDKQPTPLMHCVCCCLVQRLLSVALLNAHVGEAHHTTPHRTTLLLLLRAALSKAATLCGSPLVCARAGSCPRS